MRHLDDLETVELTESFGRALIAEGRCDAVLVEADEAVEIGATRTGIGDRSSVAIHRVGEAFVGEVHEDGGDARWVGFAPGVAETYADRVAADDGWKTLSVGGGTGARGILHGAGEAGRR